MNEPGLPSDVGLVKLAHLNQLTTGHLLQINLAILRNQILAQPKHDDPRRLLRHGFRVYSKSEEDGIIQEIFNRIGIINHTFVEIGTEWGIECNTVKLLVEGWSGAWVDGDPQSIARMKTHFASFIAADKLKAIRKHVTVENVNELVPDNLDILSIDIDYNDYWVWEAVVARPRVVVIEYNACYPPPMSIVVPYEPHAVRDKTNYSGASLEALVRLGKRKGYTLVGCDISGSNAFFVFGGYAHLFYDPATAAELYEPQRPYFSLGQYNYPSPRPFIGVPE